MKISRSRPGSSIRAIARRFWRFTISCAPPMTSPTMRPCRPAEKLAHARSARRGARRQRRQRARGRDAANRIGASATSTPKHAQDLLAAFRLDVTKLRYRDWDDLISYCSLSAMPVGRFVCDVHGESRAVWPANDALCAALQIINHLQDCQEDYRNLDRVYVPLDALAAVRARRRGARRAACITGTAALPAHACGKNRMASGRERCVCRPGRRSAPCARNRR